MGAEPPDFTLSRLPAKQTKQEWPPAEIRLTHAPGKVARGQREKAMRFLTVGFLAAGVGIAGGARAEEPLRREAAGLFGRIEAGSVSPDGAEARLGRALFWDTRVSADGKTACASCHAAGDWGADRRAVSLGARRAAPPRP